MLEINIINIIFLILIIIFGTITSITDIKFGKIRNKHLLIFLVLGFVVHIFSWIFLKIQNILNISYIFQTISIFIFSIILGYILWLIGVWTPGDGKIFSVLVLLIPVSVYEFGTILNGNFNFSSINLLINTFVPIFIYLVINMFIRSPNKKKLDSLKRSFSHKILLLTIVSIFSYFWIIKLISDLFSITPNFLLSFFIILILFILTEKVFMTNSIKVLIIISVLRIFLDSSWRNSDYLLDFFIWIIIFVFIRFFVVDLGFSTYSKDISVTKLKPGMVLADMIYEKNKKIVKTQRTFFNYFKEDNTNNIKAEGMTKKDIENLKILINKDPKFKTVRILDTLPFAPFISAGAISIFIFSGNIIISIIQLIK